MNIKQALKRKNKLAGQLKEALQIAVEVNSVVVGTKTSYSSQQKWSEAKSIMSDLVSLKAKIHRANAPVADLIFRASEIKSMISILKGMSCSDGPVLSYRATEPIMYEATIGQLHRDRMVSVFETELDTINDRLDEFNAVTKIED